jgi:AcrR family transcriptional regulator
MNFAAYPLPSDCQESSCVNCVLDIATRRFLQDGYTLVSVAQVAQGARVSTRTIYKHFTNKAGLWTAVVTRLMMRDMNAATAETHVDMADPRQALTALGEFILARACAPDVASLFRIVANDARRFPDLAARVRGDTKVQLENAVAYYLRNQIRRGTLRIADPPRAAALFVQMVCAELREYLLFGSLKEIAKLDHKLHMALVVDIFLNGAVRRNAPDNRPLG